MRLHPRSKVGVAATLFVFLVAISAEATIVDDLINVINTVNDLLGQAKSMAKVMATQPRIGSAAAATPCYAEASSWALPSNDKSRPEESGSCHFRS